MTRGIRSSSSSDSRLGAVLSSLEGERRESWAGRHRIRCCHAKQCGRRDEGLGVRSGLYGPGLGGAADDTVGVNGPLKRAAGVLWVVEGITEASSSLYW